MSTMAVVTGGIRSTLNPNAPLFIPAAIQQVEDFSPQWWELVKTTTWFREHWFRQHQDQETFDGDEKEDEDVANLLPDSVDLDIEAEFSSFEAELDEAYDESLYSGKKFYNPNISNYSNGLQIDAAAVIKSLTLNSPKSGTPKPVTQPAKYREMPVQCLGPMSMTHCIIHQPR